MATDVESGVIVGVGVSNRGTDQGEALGMERQVAGQASCIAGSTRARGQRGSERSDSETSRWLPAPWAPHAAHCRALRLPIPKQHLVTRGFGGHARCLTNGSQHCIMVIGI